MVKILVIDDSFLQRHILKGFVTNRGYEAIEASGGAEGLAALESHDIDVVLCDLLMPDMSGFEVLDAIRTAGKEVPVVMITADIQTSSRDKCFQLGANAFLNKPVPEEELNEVLDSLVSKSESA